MHATSSIPTMPATAVKLSFLRSSKTMLGVDQQYPPVKWSGRRPLPQGQPRYRTTHYKNLCPLGSLSAGFSTRTAYRWCAALALLLGWMHGVAPAVLLHCVLVSPQDNGINAHNHKEVRPWSWANWACFVLQMRCAPTDSRCRTGRRSPLSHRNNP